MNTMKDSEVLRAAKTLIENPENWVQKSFAKADRNGDKSDHLLGFEPGATCWCTVGAIQKVLNTDMVEHFERLLGDAAKGLVGHNHITAIRFNDNHTHAEVMAMFDEAIERAEANERS